MTGPEHRLKVSGICPSCGGHTLFLGNGGHVTCSLIGCADPCRADRLLHDQSEELHRAYAKISDQAEQRDKYRNALEHIAHGADMVVPKIRAKATLKGQSIAVTLAQEVRHHVQ